MGMGKTHMAPWLIVSALIIFAVAVFAIAVQFYRSFSVAPLQSAIRAFIGIVALLISTLGVPNVNGTVKASLDWGRFLKIEPAELQVSAGPSLYDALAWFCVTMLFTICLIRVPSRP